MNYRHKESIAAIFYLRVPHPKLLLKSIIFHRHRTMSWH